MSLGPDPARCLRSREATAGGRLGRARGQRVDCAQLISMWMQGTVMTLASPAPQTLALLLPGADFGGIKAAAKQTPQLLASPGLSLLTLRPWCPVFLGPYKPSKPSFKPVTSQRLTCRASRGPGADQCPYLLSPPGQCEGFSPTTAKPQRAGGGGKPSAEPSVHLPGTLDAASPSIFKNKKLRVSHHGSFWISPAQRGTGQGDVQAGPQRPRLRKAAGHPSPP